MYYLVPGCRNIFVILFVFSLQWSGVVAAEPSNSVDYSNRISAAPLTLDIHFHFHDHGNAVYNNEWPVEKRASELTGIALNNVTPLDIDNGIKAFNLLIASGDLPDIVGGTNLREKFNQYGPLGHFLPLNDLIEKHAPNIHAFFQANPNLLRAISGSDGKLYHIPYVPDGKFGRAYFIRHDWLDTLGLEAPNDISELYNVLTSFKKQDPNRNGLEDEIPFFARSFQEMVRLVTLWDARTSGTDTWHDFYIAENMVRHGYIEENYRTGISNLAKWYAEGLIDNDVYSREGDIRMQLLASNRGGMTHDWFASTASFNDKLATQIDNFEFKAMPPPKTFSGKRIEEHRRTAVKPDGWAITKKNRAIVETIKYFDFWFTPIGKRLANFGVEGQEYTLVDGEPIFKDKILNGNVPVNTNMWSVGAQVPRGFLQDYAYEKQWTNKIALEGIELYQKGDYLLEPFHGVAFNKNEKETFDFYWGAILQFMLERQEEWIQGIRDVDQDWQSYLTQLEKLGIQKVMAVMQTAYDRQYTSGISEQTSQLR